MKALVIAATLLFAPIASHAASPEENYLAARNAAIKTLAESSKRGTPDKQIASQQNRALSDLEKQIRRIIGSPQLKGVGPTAKINLEGLLEGDQEFGMLDGMLYMSANGRTRIVVTTQNLLKNWINDNRGFKDTGEQMPQGMAPALRWAPFYTRAFGSGAAVGGFAEIPVGTDTGFATALLVARAQDIGPRNPGELIVALVRGQRVFIVSAETSERIMPIAECEALWPALKAKADTAFEAYRASDIKDKSILDRQNKLSDDTDREYRRCFGERAARDVNYKKIVAQAQAIVDGLPMK